MKHWTSALLVGIATLGGSVYAQTGGGLDPFRARGGQPGTVPSQGAGANAMASAEFVDTPITDVLRVVSDLTGWSIIMSPAVSTQPPKVNLWVKNMAPAEVLQQVVELSGLVLHRDGAAYHVMTFDEYARRFGVERKVRQLQHVSADEVAEIISPFVEGSEAARVVPAEAGNKVILLVPQPLLGDLERLIDTIDVPFAQDEIAVVRLTYLDASDVVPELEKFLVRTTGGGRTDTRDVPTQPNGAATQSLFDGGGEGEGRKAGESLLVQFMVEPKLNAVVLRGLPTDVKRTSKLLQELDVAPHIQVVSYELKYTDAEEAFETIERLAGIYSGSSERPSGEGNDNSRTRLAVSTQNNRVIVEGPAEAHARMTEIIAAVDQPLPPGSGDIRVYRLENATADEIVGVLQELLEAEDRDPTARTGTEGAEGNESTRGSRGAPSSSPVTPTATPTPNSNTAISRSGKGIEAVLGSNQIPPRVTAAPEINAVVVRASAAEHDALASVIADLDLPRDQVLIEVTLVSVATDDEFSLGVEVGGSQFGTIGTIGLTSFGIGAADPATGNISIAPTAPFGLNFSVFNGDDISLVLNALKTVGQTRISSAPKLLVSDNSPGEIRQIDEEPFTTASQSDSSTITSFGGFVEAGTILQVVPHISKDDWLRLDYTIELSSFGPISAADAAIGIPPARTVNNTRGTVRIPAGDVVVLGGLVSKLDQNTLDAVPFLSDIPLLGEIFKSRSETKAYGTLYIFIRPVILRDAKFRDLLLLSEDDIRRAEIGDDQYPSNPLKLLVPPPDKSFSETTPFRGYDSDGRQGEMP